MSFSGVHIPARVAGFFEKNRISFNDLEVGNHLIQRYCGIADFFETAGQLTAFKKRLIAGQMPVQPTSRRAYGDFQTNKPLARKAVQYISGKCPQEPFSVMLEPTCGKGNFILAALTEIDTLKKIIGIEIYQPYIWTAKLRILDFFLSHPHREPPEIRIIRANVFDFDFEHLSREINGHRLLILGNPPWVTNAELGSLNASNLPEKSNFKNFSGLDAITGKGNFDIGEYISLMLLRHLSHHSGYFAFLVKSVVPKNLLVNQKEHLLPIAEMEHRNINARKEFGAAVDACLFLARLNQEPGFSCSEWEHFDGKKATEYGWVAGHFVYSISNYRKAKNLEGQSSLDWRQGVKHDCSKVMEFEPFQGGYINGLKEEFQLEPNLVYGLLKSSALKEPYAPASKKSTIITQKKIGQNTDYIRVAYPLTFKYLRSHKHFFDKRKSSVYKGKPDYSIFGIGPYAFAPYKVAISGLYKSTHFTLVLPEKDKPVMLDDTCYFLGFQELPLARIAHFLLNHERTQQFLKAIIFPAAKRPVTKAILMRISLRKLHAFFRFKEVQPLLKGISLKDWDNFGALANK